MLPNPLKVLIHLILLAVSHSKGRIEEFQTPDQHKDIDLPPYMFHLCRLGSGTTGHTMLFHLLDGQCTCIPCGRKVRVLGPPNQ